MAYVTRDQIEALLPSDFLTEALDDDNDGVEDAGVLDQLIEGADSEVDGLLSSTGCIEVPFADDAVPAYAKNASLAFVMEALYARRGYGPDTNPVNPWHIKAERHSKTLKTIAEQACKKPNENIGGLPKNRVVTITQPATAQSVANRIPV